MEKKGTAELASVLETLPPVEFCCVYGSSLLPNNRSKSTMVDYVLGVRDPIKWHAENLKMNRDHYASWMLRLGGSKLISAVADQVGVGVHFNPYVARNEKILKYGVVRVDDLIEDILSWKRFYLSGRLQKPVQILVDTVDFKNVNLHNMRAATAAAMLVLPPNFTEETLYAEICKLSYTGDLRMLFAEDKNKVNKIVEGQLESFKKMYKPVLKEYETQNLLEFSSSGDHHENIIQDCSLSSARCLVAALPYTVRNLMGMKLGENRMQSQSGPPISKVVVNSREEAAQCMQKVVRRLVMRSSVRQAVSGLIAVGGLNATRYVASKICKAYRSWIA